MLFMRTFLQEHEEDREYRKMKKPDITLRKVVSGFSTEQKIVFWHTDKCCDGMECYMVKIFPRTTPWLCCSLGFRAS